MTEQQLITIVAAILYGKTGWDTSVEKALAIRNAVAEAMEPEGASLVAMARPESVTTTFHSLGVCRE